jgi:hypothetical protein
MPKILPVVALGDNPISTVGIIMKESVIVDDT